MIVSAAVQFVISCAPHGAPHNAPIPQQASPSAVMLPPAALLSMIGLMVVPPAINPAHAPSVPSTVMSAVAVQSDIVSNPVPTIPPIPCAPQRLLSPIRLIPETGQFMNCRPTAPPTR